jgi:hypothetical protein
MYQYGVWIPLFRRLFPRILPPFRELIQKCRMLQRQRLLRCVARHEDGARTIRLYGRHRQQVTRGEVGRIGTSGKLRRREQRKVNLVYASRRLRVF